MGDGGLKMWVGKIYIPPNDQGNGSGEGEWLPIVMLVILSVAIIALIVCTLMGDSL